MRGHLTQALQGKCLCCCCLYRCHLGLEPLFPAPSESPPSSSAISSRSAAFSKLLRNSSSSVCWDLGYPKAGFNLGVVTVHTFTICPHGGTLTPLSSLPFSSLT